MFTGLDTSELSVEMERIGRFGKGSESIMCKGYGPLEYLAHPPVNDLHLHWVDVSEEMDEIRRGPL